MKKLFVLISLFGALLGSFPAFGSTPLELCQKAELKDQPIMTDGRTASLSVYAEKMRRYLFPSRTCPRVSAVALYCLLGFGERGRLEQEYSCSLNLKLNHQMTAALMKLEPDVKSVPLDVARRFRSELESAYRLMSEQGRAGSGFGVDVSELLARLDKIDAIERGDDWKVLTEGHYWMSLNDALDVGSDSQEVLLLGGRSLLSHEESRQVRWEVLYERIKPFHIAMLVCLLGFMFSLLVAHVPRLERAANLSFVLVLLLELFGLVARMAISGRAPVTNMYETVLWTGFGIFALGILLGLRFKDKRIWAAGFAGNGICLFMMGLSARALDGSIQPLVPVLRDNFWLSIHVMTITLSYSCFGLSWIISNFLVLGWLRGCVAKKHVSISLQSLDRWNSIIRLSLQIGVVFLAAGILLGGVWADYAWGRFWGWDPKETWSLIALIVYMVILHGRYAGWFKGIHFPVISAAGFLSILMAWFGVNYVLASGLHSYGFSSGGAFGLIAVIAAQVLLLTLFWFFTTVRENS